MVLETIAAVVTALLATALLAVFDRWLRAPHHRPMRCMLTRPVEQWSDAAAGQPQLRGRLLPFRSGPGTTLAESARRCSGAGR